MGTNLSHSDFLKQRGDIVAAIILVVGVVSVGILAGKQLVQVGTKLLPRAATSDCSTAGGPCGTGIDGRSLGTCCKGYECRTFPDGGICEIIPTETPIITRTPSCSTAGGSCGSGIDGRPLGSCCDGYRCRIFPDGGICEIIPTETPTITPT